MRFFNKVIALFNKKGKGKGKELPPVQVQVDEEREVVKVWW